MFFLLSILWIERLEYPQVASGKKSCLHHSYSINPTFTGLHLRTISAIDPSQSSAYILAESWPCSFSSPKSLSYCRELWVTTSCNMGVAYIYMATPLALLTCVVS